MASNKALRRTFELVDKATMPLKGIQRGFRAVGQTGAGAMAALRRAQRRLRLDRLAGSVVSVGRAARTALAPVGKLAGSLAALAGIGGIGGLGSIVTGFGREGDSIAKAADRLGLAVQQYQELRYAAGRGGFEQGFDQSMRTLNQRIGDAKNGNKELAQLFRDLNIPLEDANGNLRTAGDMLPDIAEAFKLNENAVTRTAIATKLFEAEGVGMINVLKGGREELARMRAEARENGLLTEQQARLAEQQQDAIFNLGAAWRGLSNAIGGELAPTLLPLIRSLREWINANREWIASGITRAVEALAARLKEVDWKGIARSAFDFAKAITNLVESTIGWKWALVGVATILGAGVIANVVNLALALLQLGRALAVASAFMLATPIGWFLGAIALLAGAVYLIYKNWDKVVPWFGKQFQAIKDIFSGLIDFVLGVFWWDLERALGGIKKMFDGFLAYFKNSWEGITGTISAVKDLAGFGDDEDEEEAGEPARADPRKVRGGSLVGRNAQNNASRIDVSGKTEVEVNFKNAPAGTRVAAKGSGNADQPKLDVGYGLMGQEGL